MNSNEKPDPQADQPPARPPLPPKPPLTEEQLAYYRACGQRASGVKKHYTRAEIALRKRRLKEARKKRWPPKVKPFAKPA